MNIKKNWATLDKKRVGIACGCLLGLAGISALLGWGWLATVLAFSPLGLIAVLLLTEGGQR